MRIGFDVSPLVRAFPPGVSRAVERVLDALEQRGRLDVVRLAPPPGMPLRRWRTGELVGAVKQQGLAGLHSFTSAFAPFGSGLRMQTIHELPWRHGVRENAGFKHRAWAALGPLRADGVLVPTNFVARDLSRRWLPGRSKIRVAPWGVGAPFAADPPAGAIDEVVLGRYALGDGPLLLAPGAVRPKKGLARLLHGLAVLKARGSELPQLVITGPETHGLRRDLGLASKLGLARYVTTLGQVEERDLPALLRLAVAVPVLSYSEGFGLPILEALASATTVIVPRASAQAEVAGDCGLHVDADDPEAVADAIEGAEEQGEATREHLLERASQFPWERAAACVEEAWLELR